MITQYDQLRQSPLIANKKTPQKQIRILTKSSQQNQKYEQQRQYRGQNNFYNVNSNNRFRPLSYHPNYSFIRQQLLKMHYQKYGAQKILQILDEFNQLMKQKNSIKTQWNQINQSKRQYNSPKLQKFMQKNTDNKIKNTYRNFSLADNILYKQYKDQIKNIFGKLAQLILQMQSDNQLKNIDILFSGHQTQIYLSKKTVVYLLALMAFNLIPNQYYHQDPNLQLKFNKTSNFDYIFNNNQYKTTTIIQFFQLYFQQKKSYIKDKEERLSIRRQIQHRSINELLIQFGNNKMNYVDIVSNQTSIQEFVGQLKVDFANKIIGGGALTRGCVQEQIMFANHPQLYISTLLSQQLKDNQTIVFIGFKKYFKNIEYSYNTKYAGQEKQISKKYILQKNKTYNQYIVAMDAIDYKNDPMQQFKQIFINRQLKKAFCGFNIKQNIDIVTGSWGCGAFKGNLSVKFIIQWMAASMVGRKLIYCPFGSFQKYQRQINYLKQKKVNQIYQLLMFGCSKIIKPQQNVIQYMLEKNIHYIKKRTKQYGNKDQSFGCGCQIY